MRSILVPTDFSDCSYRAAKAAAAIAEKSGATIYLLHIIDLPVSISTAGVGVAQEDIPESIFLMKKARMEFDKMLNDPMFRKVRVIEAVDFATTYEKIIDRARQHEVDLIVMGSHGATGFKEFFIGSNTERVASMATCPVLTVKEEPDLTFRRIVFASDFAPEVDDAFRKVEEFASIFNSELHLLKVNTPVEFESSLASRRAIEDFKRRTNATRYPHVIFNDYSAQEGMENFAAEINASVIALATHGRSGIGQLVKGNITAGLINHSRSMILSFRI